MEKRIPILIDTDPGVDDLFCLAIACAFGDAFDLKAVTTIGGNSPTAVTTKNALDILSLFGRADVPVVPGEIRYLCGEFGPPVTEFHGRNGVGDVVLLPSPSAPETGLTAAEKIFRTAAECGGELVLVTIGPETNLGIAFRDHPELARMVKKVVVMGGSTGRGNISPWAEANIGHDPEAAAIVFGSGVPVDMVGLNVTMRCPVSRQWFDGVSERTDPFIRGVFQQLIDFRGKAGSPLHDAIAIATLLDEEMMVWHRTKVEVITDDVPERGRTALRDGAPEEERNCRVAVDVRPERFLSVMAETAARFPAR